MTKGLLSDDAGDEPNGDGGATSRACVVEWNNCCSNGILTLGRPAGRPQSMQSRQCIRDNHAAGNYIAPNCQKTCLLIVRAQQQSHAAQAAKGSITDEGTLTDASG